MRSALVVGYAWRWKYIYIVIACAQTAIMRKRRLFLSFFSCPCQKVPSSLLAVAADADAVAPSKKEVDKNCIHTFFLLSVLLCIPLAFNRFSVYSFSFFAEFVFVFLLFARDLFIITFEIVYVCKLCIQKYKIRVLNRSSTRNTYIVRV